MATRGRPRGFDRDVALRRAMEIFWERGYEGTSIGDLTAAMGIRPPSLYAAFGDKETLFREAVARYEAENGAAMSALQDAPTARDGVAAMLSAYAADYTVPGRPTGCMIVLAATTYTPATAGIRDHLAESRRATTAAVHARLARARAEGDLPSGSDPSALAAYVTAVQFGMSVQARDGATREDLLAVVNAAMAGWEAWLRPVAEPAP